MSSPSRPLLPINCYSQRTAAKDGACFICGHLTPSLFMTVRGTPADWFYVCPEHTSMSAFCSPFASAAAGSSAVVAQAEQSSSSNRSRSSSNDAETKDGNSEAQSPPSASTQYVLHKDYMYLRQRPHIKRWEREHDKAFAQNFPSIPRNRPK
ncbi:hypothetical protein GGH95_001585 [Coemansia sp. RSA 1836]|nr:hypothetical protein GGH95_001585 [Coemansia sp. RSA 1836]